MINEWFLDEGVGSEAHKYLKNGAIKTSGYNGKIQCLKLDAITADPIAGDIGKMDKDGYVYITDRLKDMIIYKGYNVYPRELEEVLFQHPAVEQCAVLGKKDADVGEFPVAFIQLSEGAKATTDELLEFVNPKVAAYKKVRQIIFVELIPASAAGKVLKRELRKQLE
ncbi:hypothetical protein KKA14_04015 [bacterium]|nr:hypothetical protein [bacterium]